ncbi:predicted protein [Uncinocarpus reesii 1704]|uniref:N-acetyltransferase domain-containing protein n=1 Tax=Uncinocarpus reesii (strain UAMH 1704) TaxID=336963 RepID=C4JTS2_UNCRE|nr:uncharacterized protein UREG_05861 [Uncinocarpus reesii 1704]EEP81019.1 predicted protein [Uncinocarpus reesii 1704]
MKPDPAVVVRVPQGTGIPSTTLKILCRRFQKARLAALQADPSAFSSTYERESQFDDAAWAQRLQNPAAQTFVALVKNRTEFPPEGQKRQEESKGEDIDEVIELLSNHEWMGMIVLVGPKALAADGSESAAPWKAFASMGPSSILDMASLIGAEAAYFAASMFVLPGARRQGLGRKLITHASEVVKRDCVAFGASKLNINLLVAAENTPAISLYHNCGFEVVPGASPASRGVQETDLATVAMVRTTEIMTGS